MLSLRRERKKTLLIHKLLKTYKWFIKNIKLFFILERTMGSGIAQAFAMTEGYEVRLCDIKEEYAQAGFAKIQKNINFLVSKDKLSKEAGDAIISKIKVGLNDICSDCDLIVEVAL